MLSKNGLCNKVSVTVEEGSCHVEAEISLREIVAATEAAAALTTAAGAAAAMPTGAATATARAPAERDGKARRGRERSGLPRQSFRRMAAGCETLCPPNVKSPATTTKIKKHSLETEK